MFRTQKEAPLRQYRTAMIALLLVNLAALAVTVWMMTDLFREQGVVRQLTRDLPAKDLPAAETLAGDLRWQSRLSSLIALNSIAMASAMVMLWRAYRHSQDSLRDIKALATDILSSLDQAVITTDNDGLITSINRRGLDLLVVNGDCIGTSLAQLCPSIGLEEFRQQWKQGMSAALTRDYSSHVTEAPRIWRAFCQGLNDHRGEQIGNVLQLRDETERVLIEHRMRRMERYLGLGALSAGLHHEIKNPLAALSLHVQLLEEAIAQGDESGEVKGAIDVIKTEVARVGRVLEGFRDFASVDRLNLQRMDIAAAVERQVKLILPQAMAIGIDFNVSSHPAAIDMVVADQTRLEQVLHNILVNAMEAMPHGGTIEVRTVQEHDSICVHISDCGCGIPQTLLEKIFDPYFSTKSSGSGLGLALSDKIMRQHGGILTCDSSPRGTTFSVTLPVKRAHKTALP